jgi:GNAT superfamily N-acetyltransferase
MSDALARPFTTHDVDASAELLAARHRAHRGAFPQLDPKFADPTEAAIEIEKLLAMTGASGAVAVDGTEVVAYVIGYPKSQSSWGANIWVEAAGSASLEAEALRAAYATAAARWVADGRTAHYVLAPATDTLTIDAWSRLAFGQQHAHGLRSTATAPPAQQRGIAVRSANAADLDVLARLEPQLAQYQSQSPVFSAATPQTYDEALADWREALDEESSVTVVAVVEGRVVGAAYGCDLSKSSAHSGLARVPNAVLLAWAVVLPENRGAGVGRALEQAVADWAESMAYAVIVTDWRVTNLLSSRAWTAAGYRQTFLRMHRFVGY